MKCVKCDKQATVRFSPDIDVNGIHACDDHKEKVGLYLVISSINNDYEIFNKYINGRSSRKTN